MNNYVNYDGVNYDGVNYDEIEHINFNSESGNIGKLKDEELLY